jgi:hypothetical protein
MTSILDKKLPKPLDQTETYRSAGEAFLGGAVAPHGMKLGYDKLFGRPKTFNGKMGRTLGAKLLTSALAEIALGKKKAIHDSDPKSGNIHIMNMATILPEILKDVWDQRKEDKKREEALKRKRGR